MSTSVIVSLLFQTSFSEENDFAFSQSAPENQPTVAGITLVDQSGDEFAISGLVTPVKVYQNISGVKAELKEVSVGTMTFTKFNVSSGALLIEISPVTDGLACSLYVGFNEPPNETAYDWMAVLDFSKHKSQRSLVTAPEDAMAYLGYVWRG